MRELRPPVGWWTVAFLLLTSGAAVATTEDSPVCSCIGVATAAAVIAAVLCLASVGAIVFVRRRRAEPGRKEDLEAAERAAYVNPNFKDDVAGDQCPGAATDLSADDAPYFLGSANGSPGAFKVARENRAVHLRAQDFAGLGFTVSGSLKDGVFIKDVLSKGPAAMSGKVKVGDRLLALTVVMETCTQEDAVSLLSSASPYPVVLHLHQPTFTKAASSTATSTARADTPQKGTHESTGATDAGDAATEPAFKSNSSGDLSQVSPRTRTRQLGPDEEAMVGHADNPITRISDSAIDQLVDSRLSRDSKQGRHSERAIDVPDSALKASSVYGDPHASVSERAIDVSDSALKPSSGYGELQTSLSERAIDVPETALQSSSGHKELQFSLSERAIDVPDSLLKSSEFGKLHYSLSDRALDVPTSKLKPASAFGELPSSSSKAKIKFSSGELPTECTDEEFCQEKKILEESVDAEKESSYFKFDSSTQENSESPVTPENEKQTKAGDCSPISASHKFYLSSVENDAENVKNAAVDISWPHDSYDHENLEPRAGSDEVTVAESSLSILSSEVDDTTKLDSSSSETMDEEGMGRIEAERTREVEHPTDGDLEIRQCADPRQEAKNIGNDSLGYESGHQNLELADSQDEDIYLDTEHLREEEDRTKTKEKIASDSEEHDILEEVESIESVGDSDDNITAEKSTEVIRIISALPNVPLSEMQPYKSSSVVDKVLLGDAEIPLKPAADNQTEGGDGLFSNAPTSLPLGSRDIRAHKDESLLTGPNISGNAAKVAAGHRVSSPNDRSNIFGMYVNHDFNEAANEIKLSSSGRGYEVTVDENTEMKLNPSVQILKNSEGDKDVNLRLKTYGTESIERDAESSKGKTSNAFVLGGELECTSEEDDLPLVKSERKISLFSFDMSKPKKSTFELRMASSDNLQDSTANIKASDATMEESDTSELSVTENELPEVDTYLTEISSVIHELPKERNFEGRAEADSDFVAPTTGTGFGTVFGFRGFKKHIPRSDTSRSDVREDGEIQPTNEAETTEKVPVSKINSVSVLRMNFESSFEIQPSDDDDTSLSSFNRHYLPESEAYLPSNPIRIETNYPGNTIEIGGGSGNQEKGIGPKSGGSASETQLQDDELEAEAESSVRIPRARHSLYQRVSSSEIGSFSNARAHAFREPGTDQKHDYAVSPPETQNHRSENQQQEMPHLNTSDSDSDAMIMAAEVAVAHRRRKTGPNMGSSILIKTDTSATVAGELSNSTVNAPATFASDPSDPVTVSNSVIHKQTRGRRPLSNPGITFGRIISSPEEITDDDIKHNLQTDNVYIVSNFNPQRTASPTRANEEIATIIGSASEVTVVSNDNKYISESDEMKKRAASLDDLSYIPNRVDDSLLERAMSLEFKLAHGHEKNSFRTRRNNLPRSSTSMREVERSSMISVDNLLDKDRDHSPSQNRRADVSSKGHSHSVFVQSYRRDQRATSLEGIPSSLTRSNSSKLAVHQSNVTVRSNPTLSLSTHNISPTNLKVNYDSTGVELDEQRGGIVSNIEISGDRGVSITSLTHSSPWPSTSSETDHLSSFEQSPPHSSIHSPPEMVGTTTIHVLEASTPMEPLNYLTENLSKGIEVSDVYRNQYLNLKTNGLDSDTEDEVTVTTGDASFYTGPGDLVSDSRSNEWTHVNGNMRSIDDDFTYTDNSPNYQTDIQDAYQMPTGDHPEKTILTSMTQIRVLGERNDTQNNK